MEPAKLKPVEVEAGRFSEALYYRLPAFRLTLSQAARCSWLGWHHMAHCWVPEIGSTQSRRTIEEGVARMVGLLFMVALLLGFGSQPALAAEAVRIDSINPSCAGVGAQVSITGIGFGAKNVKITVGDVLAQVVTATGTTATFLVPQGAPSGSTTVTATNPGGHTGSVCFQVKGPDVTCPSVDQGLLALARGDLRAANEAFCLAIAANPSDDRANLYFAITRIAATALDEPRLAALANRSGVIITGDSRDVCGLHVTFPQEVPSGAPRTGEILAASRDIFLPEIDAALENVSHLSDAVEIPFDLMTLPSCLRPASQRFEVEIDRGDVLALAAALHGAQALFDILAAYDLDADLRAVIGQTPQAVLAAAPALLTLESRAALATARGFVDHALATLSLAIEAVRAETDDQANDLLVIIPQDIPVAERALRILDLVRQSLQRQVVLPTDVGLKDPERLDLSRFFSARFGTLRPFLPAFNDRGGFDLRQFPDPTFGGTTPDLTQQDIDDALVRLCESRGLLCSD